MKICIVQGPFFPIPPIKGGAVEKVWHNLAKEFTNRGHKVTHISRKYVGLPPEESIDCLKNLRISGFDQPSTIGGMKLYDLIYSLRVFPRIPQSDIIVTNTFWLPMLLSATKKGKVYVHVQRFPRKQMIFYKNAARIQTVSKIIHREILRQTPSVKNIVGPVIHNPLPAVFNPLEKLDYPREKGSILYVGRIHPEKGLDLFLDSFISMKKKFPNNLQLTIVGPYQFDSGGGGESYLNALKDKTRHFKREIHWQGAIFDDHSLRELYAKSEFFVYPSIADKGEAMPLAPLEAMSMGCIPILSDLECFNEYIEENINGLVFKSKPQPRQNIDYLLEQIVNGTLNLSKLSKKAQKKAEQFSLSRIADQYINDFKSII